MHTGSLKRSHQTFYYLIFVSQKSNYNVCKVYFSPKTVLSKCFETILDPKFLLKKGKVHRRERGVGSEKVYKLGFKFGTPGVLPHHVSTLTTGLSCWQPKVSDSIVGFWVKHKCSHIWRCDDHKHLKTNKLKSCILNICVYTHRPL